MFLVDLERPEQATEYYIARLRVVVSSIGLVFVRSANGNVLAIQFIAMGLTLF